MQEDFVATGDETRKMPDSNIHSCDSVNQLVGDMTEATAKPQSVSAISQCYP
jgi:hypothetical protein